MKNQNNKEYIAKIQALNSEKGFLMELYHKLQTQYDAIRDRIDLINLQIIAEQRAATKLPPKKL